MPIETFPLINSDFKNANLSGIYQIRNTMTNDSYIGSSVKFRKRMENHRNNLIKNKHHNIILQRVYNKYGVNLFEVSILELCEIDKLIEREQYYIDNFNPKYNICKIAGSLLGYSPSEETRKKLSVSGRGKRKPEGFGEKVSKALKGRKNTWVKEYAKLGTYSSKGEKHGMSKLTKEEVIKIREMKNNNIKRKDIIKMFPMVSKTTIDRLIYSNSSWEGCGHVS